MFFRDTHHFDAWLEAGAFFLIDDVDFHIVGFLVDRLSSSTASSSSSSSTASSTATAKVILCFVVNNHLQIYFLQFLVVQRLQVERQGILFSDVAH